MNLKNSNHEIRIKPLAKFFNFDYKILNLSFLENDNNIENILPSTEKYPENQSIMFSTLNQESEEKKKKEEEEDKEDLKEEKNNSQDPAIITSANDLNKSNPNLTEKILPTYQSQNSLHEIDQISKPNDFQFKENYENCFNFTKKCPELISYNKDNDNFNFKFISSQIVSKLFENCYKDLKIYISRSKKLSFTKKKPFSDFSNYFKELEFYEFLCLNESDTIIRYSSKENINQIVLKRCWIWLPNDINKPDFFDKAYKFLEEKYNEYIFMQSIFKISDQIVKPFGFNFILSNNQRLLITEFMMEYGGSPISKILRYNDSDLPEEKILLKFIKRICLFLKNLEDLGIIHGDLKPSNILVTKINAKFPFFLKFIDFDIAFLYNLTLKGNYNHNPRGFSQGYCSPELLKHFKFPTNSFQIFNPLKTDIYSLGIIILELMGCFETLNLNLIDIHKEYYGGYKILMNSIDTFAKTKTLVLEQNMIEVAKICLSYDPLKRLSTNELLMILRHLNQKTIKDIDQEYESLLRLRKVQTL